MIAASIANMSGRQLRGNTTMPIADFMAISGPKRGGKADRNALISQLIRMGAQHATKPNVGEISWQQSAPSQSTSKPASVS